MTPEQAEAIARVRAANRAVLSLSSALRALGDTWATAEVHPVPDHTEGRVQAPGGSGEGR